MSKIVVDPIEAGLAVISTKDIPDYTFFTSGSYLYFKSAHALIRFPASPRETVASWSWGPNEKPWDRKFCDYRPVDVSIHILGPSGAKDV